MTHPMTNMPDNSRNLSTDMVSSLTTLPVHVGTGGVVLHLGDNSCAEVDVPIATVIRDSNHEVCNLFLFVGERTDTSGTDKTLACAGWADLFLIALWRFYFITESISVLSVYEADLTNLT